MMLCRLSLAALAALHPVSAMYRVSPSLKAPMVPMAPLPSRIIARGNGMLQARMLSMPTNEYDLSTISGEVEAGKAVLLDVREEDEWNEAHVSFATHCPLSALEGTGVPKNVDMSKKIYVHCKKGLRAQKASAILGGAAGGAEVIPLKEGIDALLDYGFPNAK
mmetsp:Transcript_25838/g.75723  ORF Transcript_25838/g.75723 Transcript_25838/m.75723 type:complete len:163 (+) Transcript_25838:37-525(+)